MGKSFNKRWEVIKPLGEGGQGKVDLVRDKELYTDSPPRANLQRALLELQGVGFGKKHEEAFTKFRRAILDIVKSESPAHQGALKILHTPGDARDDARAGERIRREIEAMSKAAHPNLLRILDSNADENWFVSQFHCNGVLSDKLSLFEGDFSAALAAFRPLVAAVAELHRNGIVHRDVKPANVFLSAANELVLGDFGLVYFVDDERTRFSGSLENVGSRDWMPAWASGQKLEKLKPTFDVFTLGKLLWAMVSGRPFLRLWYYSEPEFDVEALFPDAPYIGFAERIFSRCIVEREKDCLPSAGLLLKEVDRVLRSIDLRADASSARWRCKVCGIGSYVLPDPTMDLGLTERGGQTTKIYVCSNCTNVQLFCFKTAQPPSWPGS